VGTLRDCTSCTHTLLLYETSILTTVFEMLQSRGESGAAAEGCAATRLYPAGFLHANRHLPPPFPRRSVGRVGVACCLLVRAASLASACVSTAGLLLGFPWLAVLHGGRYPRTICSCSDIVTRFGSAQQNLSSWPGWPAIFSLLALPARP
jgi:hypothetical protein